MEKARFSSRQAADSLQWIAYALILVFLAQVLTAIYPIALIQPEWMLRFSGALRGTASLPLLALGLFMLANTMDGDVSPSSKQINWMRRFATLAALGFLFLIPLQSYGTVKAINAQVEERQVELKKVLAAVPLIKKAETESELRQAILTMPGGEQLARRPLGGEVPTVRNFLLERIQSTVNRLENELKENKDKALQRIILPLSRDGLISLAYAIGFAGMGYNRFGQPTPLRRLVRSRNTEFQKEMNSRSASSRS